MGSDKDGESEKTIRDKYNQDLLAALEENSSENVYLMFLHHRSLSGHTHQMDKVNDELLMLITGNKTSQPTRNFKVVRQSAVPLTFDSNPAEVTTWLNAKGFSKPWVLQIVTENS